jgi:hypothetical protein
MSEVEEVDASISAGRQASVRIAPERAADLERLARDLKKDPAELATEFLEAEIEARHGLRYGPWLRRYMYR